GFVPCCKPRCGCRRRCNATASRQNSGTQSPPRRAARPSLPPAAPPPACSRLPPAGCRCLPRHAGWLELQSTVPYWQSCRSPRSLPILDTDADTASSASRPEYYSHIPPVTPDCSRIFALLHCVERDECPFHPVNVFTCATK